MGLLRSRPAPIRGTTPLILSSELLAMNARPHVAQNTNRRRSAIDKLDCPAPVAVNLGAPGRFPFGRCAATSDRLLLGLGHAADVLRSP